MRKFFAAALAAAMTLSMSAVSFADATYSKTAAVELKGPYRYHADSNTMRAPGEDTLRYGEGTYYLLTIADDIAATAPTTGFKPVQNYKNVEKLKVKAEFEMGESLVESVSVVKKYVDLTAYVDRNNNNSHDSGEEYDIVTDGGFTYGTDKGGYYYFVEFKVAKKETTSESDIVATLEFNRKADDEVKGSNYPTHTGIGKIKDCEQDVNFSVFYAHSYINDGKVITDREDLEWDTDYALKFDCDDEVELSFGSDNDGNNEGTFTVDVSGQGKIYFRYDTKANEAIVNANPGVKMYFLNFNNAKFNRVGEFVYEMDDIVSAYKVVGDKLVEIKGLELDSDSATFNTRVLESYVFADAELVNPVVEAPVVEAPVVEAPVTNPSTGAEA